ncbi:MAG: exopolysaccharide biosynthesis polyprenyl glycosylphosphotransferase [Candidatus Vogelbacteria bacterium]|nr:exopolysaccharide biosynthesis polyprenyl glycosylphosphotransferase [Candidatus Vogelbacteria bacterium]
MIIGRKKERVLLIAGDILSFVVAIWLTLFFRYGYGLDTKLFLDHILAFTPGIVLWLGFFFIYNLYGRPTVVFRRKVGSTIINAQIVNGILAVIIFYFVPYFGLTPKTNLFIYFIFSTALIIFWRLYLASVIYTRSPEPLLLIGESSEADSIADELTGSSYHGYRLLRRPGSLGRDDLLNLVRGEHIQIIMIHFRHSNEKNLVASLGVANYLKLRFLDVDSFFEELFDRVPLSRVNDLWFIENIIGENSRGYDFLKRVMDIILSAIVGTITLPLYPFAALAIWLEDRGPIFIKQERVGQYGRTFPIYKFRTMTGNDRGGAVLKSKLGVTRVGEFLRKTRVDELPQLWSVILGSLSLVGPRPELPVLVSKYESQIPFYNVRHFIKPGLSGWAQFYQISASTDPHHGTEVEATREKLSYDLFYLKHRSFWLDIKIAFRTLQIILSCVGV